MMTREDRQEALSLAYIKAIAAMCGMTYSIPFRDYGIDITLNEVERRDHRFFQSGQSLDIQVKSTAALVEARTTVNYDLSIKAYDDLRLESPIRRILAVFLMPPDESDWLRLSKTKLELRKCMYWTSLRGQPAVRNRASIRVSIPKHHVFTPDSLRGIMERIRAREELA